MGQDAVADATAAVTEVASTAPATTEALLAELTSKVAAAQSAADNAWILTSSALVLMMTAPGLLLFYGGLVRAKNVLSVFMQGFFLMALVSIIWLLFGYSIAFGEMEGPLGAFVGGFDHLMLAGVTGEPSALSVTLPGITFCFFQLMFAIITPALMCGAFAERFRFKALVPFMILWVIFIYLPLAHMVWGPNGFLNGWSEAATIKALDFAGGTVVHISSGVSALVIAIYLGKRYGYPGKQFVPHNLALSMTGAGLLWFGWFGFNAGSALNAGPLASWAFISTHMSAAGATMSWMVAEWLFRGKPSLLGAISGAVAGLVAVTPAAGFVHPGSGLIIGLIAGFVCWFTCAKLKEKLGYDDSLDVFGVHGVGGILGAVLTGVFAHSDINGMSGLIDGNPGQVVQQILAVLVTIVMAVIGTIIFMVLVDRTIGAKASNDDQELGLDIVDHGERAYHEAS
ncbi:ammonium transporter [bacterium]|nr:ammonium transporter [bacterium]